MTNDAKRKALSKWQRSVWRERHRREQMTPKA